MHINLKSEDDPFVNKVFSMLPAKAVHAASIEVTTNKSVVPEGEARVTIRYRFEGTGKFIAVDAWCKKENLKVLRLAVLITSSGCDGLRTYNSDDVMFAPSNVQRFVSAAIEKFKKECDWDNEVLGCPDDSVKYAFKKEFLDLL